MKPIVYYSGEASVVGVGLPAYCKPINHPSDDVSNMQVVRTSKVIRYDLESGEFETQNTIYRKEEK